MFRVYIFEDNNLFANSTKETIQLYTKSSSRFIVENIFIVSNSFEVFLQSLNNTSSKQNIYIIDIDLSPSINGLQLAKRIRSFDYDGYIIFLTAHIEMTALTFHYNLKALNFIYKGDPNLKQLLFNSLDQIVFETSRESASNSLTVSNRDYLLYTYKSNLYKILSSDILFIETHGLKRCLIIHTLDKNYECPKSINEILSELPSSFVQCHRSYIANCNHIKEIKLQDNQYSIFFSNNVSCPLSKKYLTDVLNYMKTYGN